MGIFIGGTEIKDIKIGSTAINKVFIGANQVWSRYLDQQTVTVGVNQYGFTGYYGSLGAISDGTCDFKNNAVITNILFYPFSNSILTFTIQGNHSNSGFTNMNIAGNNFLRTNASFTYYTYQNSTQWEWNGYSNPFGTTVGATKTVTWT